MNHAIGELLLSIGLLGGVLTMAFGMLSALGNMIADAAGAGSQGGNAALVVGAVLVISCGFALTI